MLADFLPVPSLNEDSRFSDWKLAYSKLDCISAANVYALLKSDVWIVRHGNQLWSHSKSPLWWKRTLASIWQNHLPLKERLFLWRCLVGVLPVGNLLHARHIAPSRCFRCHGAEETMPHLLWGCRYSRSFIQQVSVALRLCFPSATFHKKFWLFGTLQPLQSQFTVFFAWVRFWILWTIWHQHNSLLFQGATVDPFPYFKLSLRHALHFAFDTGKQLVCQAYADDSMFMPKNDLDDVKAIMDALEMYALAAGLKVNFFKY
ncbi:hypothetical protein L7F22_008297 [Adiantum nelumboides]|nr:hypothetical protein [Adiantum nelumboides]